MRFVHNWLRKRPYALCRSCRGMEDLQLSYKSFGPLMLKTFEKTPPKQCYPETFGARTRGNAGTHDVALSHVGFTAVRHRTRTPRQADDCWSVRGAEALLCVVLWAPDPHHALCPHASAGCAAVGHWPAAPPASHHWLSGPHRLMHMPRPCYLGAQEDFPAALSLAIKACRHPPHAGA
jgi:hypothetical protein